jgi:hypothetical protein
VFEWMIYHCRVIKWVRTNDSQLITYDVAIAIISSKKRVVFLVGFNGSALSQDFHGLIMQIIRLKFSLLCRS